MNEQNYAQKYYDTATNYDLSENDWKMNLNQLYNGDLVKVDIFNPNNNKKDNNVDEIFEVKEEVKEDVKDNDTEYNCFHNYDFPTKAIKNVLKKSEEFYISMDELAKKLNITNYF